VITVLSVAWGMVVVLPFVGFARRVGGAQRAGVLRPRSRRAPAPLRAGRATIRRLGVSAPARTVAAVLRAPLRARRRRHVDDVMARQVAVAVDLVGVAAGHTPYLAVRLGAQWSPPLVAHELDAAVRACGMGQSFDDALRDLGRRAPSARGLVETLRTTSRLGSPAAPALARLASELRVDLRRRSEARARTVPVRLCFPLVGCVLPAFALLTVVPAVVAGITR
jgi:Flp pilus assembly protein TadB